jgi:signal transduction histidine kinase
MGANRVAQLLRAERERIVELWVDEVRRDLPAALQAQRPVLREHAYELLAGLAAWVEGATEKATRAFGVLVENPALQALGYGMGLETLIRELGQLRIVILRDIFSRADAGELHESVLALAAGMDHAIADATSRFAQQREDVRDRFIGILGHDLREPLSSVQITARILGRHPKLRNHTDRIEQACDRMMRMVGDVLDFARGHLGGGIPARPAPHDLGEICRLATDEIGAANPERTLTIDLRGDLHAHVDRDRVIQAMTNLLSNAIQHGTGSIEVCARQADDHETIVTSVTSHGAPIPSQELTRIFDPFARADAALARPGLGLGLYIVQQIALAHGAQCEVTSSDEATTFAIRWPRGSSETRRVPGRKVA